MKALVLAAGLSTRIASVSLGTPKPLIEIEGESILSRNLRWLSRAGIRDVWINLHYQPDLIRAAIGDGERFCMKIRYIYEPEILGTAGAVKNVSPEWTSPFLVIYGDNLFRFNLGAFVASHKYIASIALFNRNTHPFTGVAGGQVVLSNDLIQSFIEGSSEEISPFVNAGAYILDPLILPLIPPQKYDFGKELFPRILRENGRLGGHVIDGYCLGIDTPSSYAQALALIKEGKVQL